MTSTCIVIVAKNEVLAFFSTQLQDIGLFCWLGSLLEEHGIWGHMQGNTIIFDENSFNNAESALYHYQTLRNKRLCHLFLRSFYFLEGFSLEACSTYSLSHSCPKLISVKHEFQETCFCSLDKERLLLCRHFLKRFKSVVGHNFFLTTLTP